MRTKYRRVTSLTMDCTSRTSYEETGHSFIVPYFRRKPGRPGGEELGHEFKRKTGCRRKVLLSRSLDRPRQTKSFLDTLRTGRPPPPPSPLSRGVW